MQASVRGTRQFRYACGCLGRRILPVPHTSRCKRIASISRVSSSSSDEENGLAGTGPDGENAVAVPVAGELIESSARVEYETSSKRPKKRPGRAPPPPFALDSASGALIQDRVLASRARDGMMPCTKRIDLIALEAPKSRESVGNVIFLCSQNRKLLKILENPMIVRVYGVRLSERNFKSKHELKN